MPMFSLFKVSLFKVSFFNVSLFKIALAGLLLAGTAVLATSRVAIAQQPTDLRAAQEEEQAFPDEQAARQADEADNSAENVGRLLILDSLGRPYMYDSIRDGFVCRAVRVPVRRTYRRTLQCGGGYAGGGVFRQEQGQPGADQQGNEVDVSRLMMPQESEETFTDEQRAAEADAQDNAPGGEDRFLFDGNGNRYAFSQLRNRYACRWVRVPTSVVTRRTISCNSR